jgi:hypothetical protein
MDRVLLGRLDRHGPDERHSRDGADIIVGNGRDYDDVAPLKGVYQGAASSSLGVVEMSRTH